MQAGIFPGSERCIFFLSSESSPKDTVRVALALYNKTGQEVVVSPGGKCSS